MVDNHNACATQARLKQRPTRPPHRPDRPESWVDPVGICSNPRWRANRLILEAARIEPVTTGYRNLVMARDLRSLILSSTTCAAVLSALQCSRLV